MKIKICGMREPDNIRQVTDLHPDYMGVIFWSGSPRNACQLDPAVLATVPQTIRRVGVFVNETEEQVIRPDDADVGRAGSDAPPEGEIRDLMGYLRDFSAGGAFSAMGGLQRGESSGRHEGGAPRTPDVWNGPFSEN